MLPGSAHSIVSSEAAPTCSPSGKQPARKYPTSKTSWRVQLWPYLGETRAASAYSNLRHHWLHRWLPGCAWVYFSKPLYSEGGKQYLIPLAHLEGSFCLFCSCLLESRCLKQASIAFPLPLARGFSGTSAAALQTVSPGLRKGKPQREEQGLKPKQPPWYQFCKPRVALGCTCQHPVHEGGVARVWTSAAGAVGAGGRAAWRLGCRLAGSGLSGGCTLWDAVGQRAEFVQCLAALG